MCKISHRNPKGLLRNRRNGVREILFASPGRLQRSLCMCGCVCAVWRRSRITEFIDEKSTSMSLGRSAAASLIQHSVINWHWLYGSNTAGWYTRKSFLLRSWYGSVSLAHGWTASHSALSVLQKEKVSTQCPYKVSQKLFAVILTRNSAVADKPRVAFVQIQWRGWPPENMVLPIGVTTPNLVVLR